MNLELITPPSAEPVTLAELKSQCGYSPAEDADHLAENVLATRLRRFGRVARQRVEHRLNRSLITQTWRWRLDRLPHLGLLGGPRAMWDSIDTALFPYVVLHCGHAALKLPKPKFQAITSFTYLDENGNQQDMTGWGYQTDTGGDFQPARLFPAFGSCWPVVRPVPNCVELVFTAGYGDAGVSVPEEIRMAILFLAQFWDERGAITDEKIPNIIWDLLDEHINWES